MAATAPAGATDDLAKYQGEEKKGVVVTPERTFENNQTTFTFTLALKEGENQVSHVLLISCPDIQIVSTSGPNQSGQITAGPTTPSNDGSINHTGIKFDPGFKGVYTIVFAGNVAAADFVVKDGDGHKHYPSGADVCQTVTETPQTETPPTDKPPTDTPPTDTPPTNNPPANNPPANNPPANNPPGTPAANLPSQSGSEVQAATAATPGSDVLGAQVTAPEAQSTLPRTGLPVPALAPIGTMLVALGGLATVLGRRGQG